ncbi:MAG: phage terminase large subunit family protein [Spirochaetes bacterium]|nr:phage terminase large subunit family protein [Spirochaetota bacterium]
MLEWAMQNIRIKIGRSWQSFSLENHEPLREFYTQPMPRHEVARKGAQLGISTYSLIKTFFKGIRHGQTTGYYFPTDEDVDDFVQDRANPMIENSETLSSLQSHDLTDNVGLKRFGKFSVYFRGVFSKRKVKSITLDHVIKDEVDEANQENLKFADDRMLHSADPAITELSQPSIDDFGIDASFKLSDSRYWAVRCGCRHWNFPDKTFPECLLTRGLNTYYRCVKCDRKLNMNAGQWVPEFPSRSKDIVGRHLSHLIFNHLSAAEVKRRYESATTTIQKKNFSISILGFPRTTAAAKPITDEVLQNAQRPYAPNAQTNFSFWGMDVGDKCHLVFLQPAGNVLLVTDFIEMQSDDEKAIIQAVEQRGGYCGVIDAMPYKTLAKNIARHFQGRVYINYYKGDTLKTGEEGQGEFAVPRVTVNRDESLDETTESVREGRIAIPDPRRMGAEKLAAFETFKAQLKMLIKEGVDKDGISEIHYKKNVPNHYGMALNYARIASEVSSVNVVTGVDPIFVKL